jgi:hypothetical protein
MDNIEAQIRAEMLVAMAPDEKEQPLADAAITMILPAFVKFATTFREMTSADFGPYSEDRFRGHLDRALDTCKTFVLGLPAKFWSAAIPPLVDAIAPFDTFGISPEGYPSYRAALEDWYAKLCAQKPESEPLPAVQ